MWAAGDAATPRRGQAKLGHSIPQHARAVSMVRHAGTMACPECKC